jgi:hypothetical protein
MPYALSLYLINNRYFHQGYFMKKLLFPLITTLICAVSFSQTQNRELLRGTVLYMSMPVANENVINNSAGEGTITNEKGEFVIPAKEGDELFFLALNYQMKRVVVDADILKKGRLVVEVNEKVMELDQVTVSPEDQKEFIRLRNEDFKGYDYETDETSEVVNIAQDPTIRGMQNGLNFVNLFKLLAGTLKNSDRSEAPGIKLSEALRQVYDDSFFVKDLGIPKESIEDFLVYCDTRMPSSTLLQKSNEFELIDFLVNQSEVFRNRLQDPR